MQPLLCAGLSVFPGHLPCFGISNNLAPFFCPTSGSTLTSTACAIPTISSSGGTSRSLPPRTVTVPLLLTRPLQVQLALLRYGDTAILFTDLVYKFNRANKMQQRVLIVTDQALYVLNEVKLSICRRIPLHELGGVSYSTIGDDYMVIHVPSHYDYLLSCSRKREATGQLQLAYRQKLGRSLCVRVYGDDQSLSTNLWMKSVWDPKGRAGHSESDRIINGMNRMGIRKTMSVLREKKMFLFGKMPTLHDPLYTLQSDQLLALLSTPHHPLGKHFVEFIDQFKRRFGAPAPSDARDSRVVLGDDPRISVLELSMTNAVSGCTCCPCFVCAFRLE